MSGGTGGLLLLGPLLLAPIHPQNPALTDTATAPLALPPPLPAVKALRAVHGRFYLYALPIGVGLVGPGLIGGTFLQQLHEQVSVVPEGELGMGLEPGVD